MLDYKTLKIVSTEIDVSICFHLMLNEKFDETQNVDNFKVTEEPNSEHYGT